LIIDEFVRNVVFVGGNVHTKIRPLASISLRKNYRTNAMGIKYTWVV